MSSISMWKRTMYYVSEFIPEPPYNRFILGKLFKDETNRKYVFLYRDINNVGMKTTYARYLYQVEYWRKNNGWIPHGYEVDHKDDDFTNDQLDNLQLLTGIENIRKRDFAKYRSFTVDQKLLNEICYYLDLGYSRNLVADKCNISHGYLRYLIQEYLHAYAIEYKESRNISDIKDMLASGMTLNEIGYKYGTSRETIKRLIYKYLPEYEHKTVIKNNIETIKEMLLQGQSQTDIAKELGCDVSNICYYIKTYLKDLYSKISDMKEQARDKLIEDVGKLITSRYDYPYHQIAELLNTTTAIVGNIVREYFPDWTEPEQYKRLIAQVGELKKTGLSTKEIAEKLLVRTDVITNALRKFYPEDTYTADAEKRFERVKELFDKGLTKKEIAKELDITSGGLSAYIDRRLPEYREDVLIEKKYTEIIQYMKDHPEMSRRKVALLFKVNRDNLKKVIEERGEIVPQLQKVA